MATIDVPTPAQRERAIRVLWLAHEFDTATIAALLGVREAEVAGVVAKREADVALLSFEGRR